MEIYPDPIHVALLTLPFLVTMLGLHVILWQPLLGYLDERDATADRARHEAHELESASTELMTKIESRLAAARQHISTIRQQARSRALAREAEIVAETRTAADQRLDQALQQITADKKAAAQALRETSADLSKQIAAQVLGRPVA
jgi:F0F1-type ATP synthase membrane subunit b/b'